MRLAWAAFALCVGLGSSGSVAAVGGTATDQAVSLVYAISHWDGSPQADLTGVDASGDPLFHGGWWYRAEGDTREFPLPAPDSETYLSGEITAIWNNLDGKGFRVQETTYVLDSEGPSGGFQTVMHVQNNNVTAKQFTLFHYVDVDLAASASGDSGTFVNGSFLKFSDGASKASYRVSNPNHFKVASFPAISNLLNDAAVTDLDVQGKFGRDPLGIIQEDPGSLFKIVHAPESESLYRLHFTWLLPDLGRPCVLVRPGPWKGN